MKKLISLLLLLIVLSNCSFDNKTGIWKDSSENVISKNIKDIGKSNKNKNIKSVKLQDIFTERKIFEEEKIPNLSFKILIDKSEKNFDWQQQYSNLNNNISNIYFFNKNNLIYKSKKLGKKSTFQSVISNKVIIFSDRAGFISAFSLDKKKKIFEYNFYKNKYKKHEKNIYLIVSKGRVYAADNFGYIYSLDLQKQKVIWAKNFGIPFRSNMKIIDNNLILANQDNTIFSINSFTGKINWKLDTTIATLQTDFINSIVIDKNNKSILYLNTSGEFYSINYKTAQLNWILNFGIRTEGSNTNLFRSLPLTIKNNHILISAQNNFSKYNITTGQKVWTIPVSVNIKPVITSKNIFLFTKNNLLVCLNSESGEILWSRNIFKPKNVEDGVKIKNFFKPKLMSPIAGIKALNQSNREKLKIKKLKSNKKDKTTSFFKNPLKALNESNKAKLELGKDVEEGIFKDPLVLDERYGIVNHLYMAASKLLLFTSEGNLMFFNPNSGKLSFNTKLANSMSENSPMFVDGSLYFFDNKTRLYQYE